MLYVYHSNEENILENYIIKITKKKTINNIFKKDIIIVQNSEISKTIQTNFAKKINISFNFSFKTFTSFLIEISEKIFYKTKIHNHIVKKKIFWEIIKILQHSSQNKELHKLKTIMCKHKNNIYQLSNCITNLFYKYLIHQPELLKTWEKNKTIHKLNLHQIWQKYIWIKLIEQIKNNKKNIFQNVENLFKHTKFLKKKIQNKIFFYNINNFPKTYFKIINILRKNTDIHILFYNPCRYFLIRNISNCNLIKNNQNKNIITKNKYFNNPLIRSCGKLRENIFSHMSKLENIKEKYKFQKPNGNTLLKSIQKDILESKNQFQNNSTKQYLSKKILKKRNIKLDKSIIFKECDTKQKEIEILRNNIIKLLKLEKKIKTKDIIVMSTNIKKYRSHIYEVFKNKKSPKFEILNENIIDIYPIIRNFISLICINENKFTITNILSLLTNTNIKNKFYTNYSEINIIKQWIDEININFEFNRNQPKNIRKNTWISGIKKLIFGSIINNNKKIKKKISPYKKCNEFSIQLIEKFINFIYLLIEWKKKLKQKNTAKKWIKILINLLNDFFEQNKNTKKQFEFIISTCMQLSNEIKLSKYNNKISIHIISNKIKKIFYKKTKNGHKNDTIKFCNLNNRHKISFKVVCLLGMNFHSYPRKNKNIFFDLINKNEQSICSSNYENDKHIFLEIISSTKKILYISYIKNHNKNIHTNKSTLIHELIEYIYSNFSLN